MLQAQTAHPIWIEKKFNNFFVFLNKKPPKYVIN